MIVIGMALLKDVTIGTIGTVDHRPKEDLQKKNHAVSHYLKLILTLDADERKDRHRSRSGGRNDERNPSAGRSPEQRKREVAAEDKVDSFVSNGGGNEGTDVERKQQTAWKQL